MELQLTRIFAIVDRHYDCFWNVYAEIDGRFLQCSNETKERPTFQAYLYVYTFVLKLAR